MLLLAALSPATKCFNPLPQPELGKIKIARIFQGRRASFNPLPQPELGKIQGNLPRGPCHETFQSASPTGVREDASVLKKVGDNFSVSIRFPNRS